jgi:hypothetical protein
MESVIMNEINVEVEKNPIFKTKKEKDWLKAILSESEVEVTFVKKDGTERKMLCTLSENKIPSEKAPKNVGKTKNDEVLAVFDIENDGWRSFRWDSIKTIQFGVGND